ncbi:T9SS type A sorting domain-containing protein [Flavitalea flava]
MNPNFQLKLVTPCDKSWNSMHPEENGRFCGSCNKTVVDFTGMSDRELITHLARAGQNVCGRLAPDQLNRAFLLQPEPDKSRWKGWPLILAGLLVASRLPAQIRQAKPRGIVGTSPVRERIAAVAVQDTMPKPVTDSFKVLPTAVVHGFGNQNTCTVYMGGLSVVRSIKITSWKQRLTDTLENCHLLPKKELSVYPNPVRRGVAISLSWQVEEGEYQVCLFNMAGALIQQRIMQVGSTAQVDLLEIPPTLPDGLYIIRAIRAGNGKTYSRKLVVL